MNLNPSINTLLRSDPQARVTLDKTNHPNELNVNVTSLANDGLTSYPGCSPASCPVIHDSHLDTVVLNDHVGLGWWRRSCWPFLHQLILLMGHEGSSDVHFAFRSSLDWFSIMAHVHIDFAAVNVRPWGTKLGIRVNEIFIPDSWCPKLTLDLVDKGNVYTRIMQCTLKFSSSYRLKGVFPRHCCLWLAL